MNVRAVSRADARRILIIEDGDVEAECLRKKLQDAGFDAVFANKEDETALATKAEDSDFVVLDFGPLGDEVISACHQLRSNPKTRSIPIVMVATSGNDADCVLGLETGADDFLVKPFSPDELIARVRAVLRRTFPATLNQELSAGEYTMDLTAHKVTCNGMPVHMPLISFKILQQFMEQPGQAFTREQLLKAVWGRNVHVGTRTVDVHIRRIRAKLSECGSHGLIRTVRSVGYVLDIDQESRPHRTLTNESSAPELDSRSELHS